MPLAPTRYFPSERFDVLAAVAEPAPWRFEVFVEDGELIIKRTELIREALKPSFCPISSADGTRFLMT